MGLEHIFRDLGSNDESAIHLLCGLGRQLTSLSVSCKLDGVITAVCRMAVLKAQSESDDAIKSLSTAHGKKCTQHVLFITWLVIIIILS